MLTVLFARLVLSLTSEVSLLAYGIFHFICRPIYKEIGRSDVEKCQYLISEHYNTKSFKLSFSRLIILELHDYKTVAVNCLHPD
jgi:hypothetical protein